MMEEHVLLVAAREHMTAADISGGYQSQRVADIAKPSPTLANIFLHNTSYISIGINFDFTVDRDEAARTMDPTADDVSSSTSFVFPRLLYSQDCDLLSRSHFTGCVQFFSLFWLRWLTLRQPRARAGCMPCHRGSAHAHAALKIMSDLAGHTIF
jgi:hypothetical protein